MMGRGLYAKLDAFKLGEADAVARQRRDNVIKYNLEAGRVVSEEQNEEEHFRGARCERAAWIFFPELPWNRLIIEDADLGDFIDVKSIRFDWHELLVKKHKIKPEWAYLLVSAENHPYYWLAGWQWGSYLIAHAPTKHARPPCYALPASALLPVWQLQKIVRDSRPFD